MSDSGKQQRVVIVGAGMAGVQTAVALREQGWPGPVRLIGAEPHPPYDRPPLSKAVLLAKGEEPEGDAPPLFDIDFAALDIELELGRTVTGLHPAERLLETDAGPVHYDRLVVATGAEPVTLPGSEGVPGVHLLRTLDDARRLRPVLAARGRIVVVGAGWIGAEFATAARERECEVTVVEAAATPLPGALPAQVTEPMRAWYADAGALLRTGVAVAAVEAGGVLLADGTRLAADAVLVGIGARPATGWLRGCGVELGADGAVLADAGLRASVPGVYAVGDCASFPSARFGERLLVHHWDNALQGPRTVAANLVAEGHADAAADSVGYDPVPYFWSEQFGRFVQYAGHHRDGDELVWRGDPATAAWSVCWLRDDRLTALLAVGRPRDLAQGRKLIQQGTAVDGAVLADAAVALKKAAR
ncbi:NAD(P)/FAD-dependent oxidoreductase [Streptomyces albus]|uniref:NAD(P)/FAD-dependent oxidoreductase n=1 Tax=Streptomyces TaxID=1883 RepID=UPI0004CCFFB2|nr:MULTISPECIES: FAD-dependent oxidoreductase [Streptomyces]QID35954.1 oxidoreductase [Streptomyces albus]